MKFELLCRIDHAFDSLLECTWKACSWREPDGVGKRKWLWNPWTKCYLTWCQTYPLTFLLLYETFETLLQSSFLE